MKKENFKELSDSDLKNRLEETRATYIKLTLNHAVSPVENPLRIRSTRRSIAQLETEVRARRINSQASKA